MRAAEFGRPLLRATNNGVTAVIDHTGQIINIIPQFTEQVLRAEVMLVEGQTPYSKWGQFISWLFALMTLTIYLLDYFLKHKKQ
jgi:apolipoprotein N-acyltransferase